MRYASIRELDISNGEGVGVALFVQGCHYHCRNCFNSETWDFNGGKEWTPDIKEKFLKFIDRPYVKRVSLLGGEPLADENLDSVLDLVTEINKKYNSQKIETENLCKMGVSENKNTDKTHLLFPQKTIWLYSGYTWEQIMYPIVTDDINPGRDELIRKRIEIVSQCDILVDGRFVDELKNISLKWRGSSNQRVIDIEKSLKQDKVVLYCD